MLIRRPALAISMSALLCGCAADMESQGNGGAPPIGEAQSAIQNGEQIPADGPENPGVGKNCGTMTATDNCGTARTVTCGTCSYPQTCGGGGSSNVCGCTPLPQSQRCAGKNCGSVSDGCSGTYSCGQCPTGQTCGGGGVKNVCGCLTRYEACGDRLCGTVSNNCTMISCGTCLKGQYCRLGECTGGTPY